MNLRFDLILAQYLYQHKKLNLPGIGTFEAGTSMYVPDDYDKQKPAMEGVIFVNKTIHKADDSLIDFITEQTGKMKPLAISDLESYLTLGKQFLYIGKPFYLEGIGTLQLAKDGRFEFIAGEYITTKLEDPNVERSEGKSRSVSEENRIKQESNTNNIKKFLLVLVILGGIALIGWGGYYFYNMYSNQQPGAIAEDSTAFNSEPAAAMSLEDSILSATGLRDTSSVTTQTDAANPGFYKFIIETTNDKSRALKRYYSLRAYGNKVTLQTRDSINYKILYNLPATAADTLRIRDSLNRYHFKSDSPIRVQVEQ